VTDAAGMAGSAKPQPIEDPMHLHLPARHALVIVALLIVTAILTEFSSRTIADGPQGPFEPTWESLKKNYRTPRWFLDGKFGIFIHWGLYSIPAHRSEWYARHMYNDREISQWHTEHYGPPDKFGYKDFVPLFKAEKYDPAAWASLFRRSGARYVVPVAEHHDGFAMYDSSLTRWNAKQMGPKRDLIGELAGAVRKQGLVFGLSYHRMEHHTFMYPAATIKSDQFDPAYADFYGPPIPGDMDDANAPPGFQEDWLARCKELVDKYRPQLVYFDNGVNQRAYDPVKLRFAAFFYNRAREWRKDVSINTKDAAYLAGSIRDYEKDVRGPSNLLPDAAPYQIDDVISDRSWGYVSDMKYRSVGSIISELVDTVSKNGNLMLNISPMGDGSIPDAQQEILLEIGTWLAINGEGIYGTRPWDRFGEGPSYAAQLAGATPHEAGREPPTGSDFRFTTKGNTLFAIALAWPGEQAIITALATGKAPAGKIRSVHLLGGTAALSFSQDEGGLRIKLPVERVGKCAYVFRIEGLKLK
jgi:alpha-L-fucosidase